MALDRNQRRGGTAGHLSGKDRAARHPTRRSPAAGSSSRRCRVGAVTATGRATFNAAAKAENGIGAPTIENVSTSLHMTPILWSDVAR
jgi:hypothetical protein